MDRRRGMGVGISRINMDQAHPKEDGGGTPLMGDSTKGDTRIKGGGTAKWTVPSRGANAQRLSHRLDRQP